MHARKLIIARVEELNKVCPGNALVWEFVQLKDLERSELANRLDIMFSRQRECSCDPDYIEKVHKDGYDAVYRRKIVELYLEVSATSIHFFVLVISRRIRPSPPFWFLFLLTFYVMLRSSTWLRRPLRWQSTYWIGTWPWGASGCRR